MIVFTYIHTLLQIQGLLATSQMKSFSQNRKIQRKIQNMTSMTSMSLWRTITNIIGWNICLFHMPLAVHYLNVCYEWGVCVISCSLGFSLFVACLFSIISQTFPKHFILEHAITPQKGYSPTFLKSKALEHIKKMQ